MTEDCEDRRGDTDFCHIVPSMLLHKPPVARCKPPPWLLHWSKLGLQRGKARKSSLREVKALQSSPLLTGPSLNHQANPGRCPTEAFPSVQYEVSGSKLILARSLAGQVMGPGRFLLNKGIMTLEVAPRWGFIKPFGNKVERMPEMDHLREMTWSSIKSTSCFRFQGICLLSQTLPAEC